ncbi:MAG: Asp-tRNA(Asn)/Glu-tRNA(Gln) amidotransferase subunit GatB [Candidatus Omnitrophica bacterium]|nr:Asp-tRNA(Asn)/Glu-tRNA(Gln) amidotransferase subunit GatB [Candidatus Omnitrophota bacterium]
MSERVNEYPPVIGLEVHLQLATASKIFCGCANSFGASPNAQVCPVCLGFPGTLPVLNRQVLRFGIRVALGLNCRIQPRIVFHRKNYFYPDLPKNYQISQYDLPLGLGGFVQLKDRRIRIHRVHMEEDAGKLIHEEGEGGSLVDFNRTGVPLLEIVSEPDLTSPEEAYETLKTLKGILQYLEVSDCDMEKGSLRCDANVSLKTGGAMGTKVEIKNLNSFKGVSRSLSYEILRQGEVLDSGGKVLQETRLWDDVNERTLLMRSKEYAHDYRYFPEPDLVPFSVSENEIEAIRKDLPELPEARTRRFESGEKLPAADAKALTSVKANADYFEECLKAVPGTAKALANWILGDLSREVNERNLESVRDLSFPPGHLVELVKLIDSGRISGKMAKEVLVEALKSRQSPAAVVQARGLAQVTDLAVLKEAALLVVKEQPQAAADYQSGKEQALMFLVGQLMRRTKGAASPAVSQEILRELLKEVKG